MLKQRLLAPGPVDVPPAVLEAMARPMMHHRTAPFKALFLQAREGLASLAMVPGDDVLILAGSGTAAVEAGVLATVPRGAKVLALHAGKFGARWLELTRAFGYQVAEVEAPWGKALAPEAVAEALRAHPDAAAVITTHSETSTGVLHDVAAIAATVRRNAPDALVLVDAVTSLAATELRPREWDLDGVFSGSQKALMLPPGLGFVWLSERAWARQEQLVGSSQAMPSYYLDLGRERKQQRQGQTAFTPAVSLVAGLVVALDLLLEEGVEAVWQRRTHLNDALLAAGVAAGFEALAERPSPAAAALLTPVGIAAPDVVRHLAQQGITIAGGQDQLKPRLVRPSVVGYADRFDVVTLAAALEEAVRALGHRLAVGSATTAALRALQDEARSA